MGRPGYPAEFRRKVLDLLAEGRSVASVAHDLDVSDQTIYNWRRQDRIDRGSRARPDNGREGRARGREEEDRRAGDRLAIAQRAVDLLREEASPKGGTRRSK